MRWEFESDDASWDESLSHLGGHPLQSALWGNARRKVDQIVDHRWRAKDGDRVIFMARIEERRSPGLGRAAWVPKGPTWIGEMPPEVERLFQTKLREVGFSLLITDRWTVGLSRSDAHASPQTIWIDLTCGADALWKGLESKARHSVARARRDGIVCEISEDPRDLEWFASLCRETEKAKGFQGPGSPKLMAELLRRRDGPAVGSLFVASAGGGKAAGALVLRCGSNLHYFWGATDRKFSKSRVGEALQWSIMEWGVARGFRLYDLEGIDPFENPGVFKFKKKLGGKIVTLEGKISTALSFRGSMLDWARRFAGR